MLSIGVITGDRIIVVSVIMCNLFSHDTHTHFHLHVNVLMDVVMLFISTGSCLMIESCERHSSTTVQL